MGYVERIGWVIAIKSGCAEWIVDSQMGVATIDWCICLDGQTGGSP